MGYHYEFLLDRIAEYSKVCGMVNVMSSNMIMMSNHLQDHMHPQPVTDKVTSQQTGNY